MRVIVGTHRSGSTPPWLEVRELKYTLALSKLSTRSLRKQIVARCLKY